MVCELCGMDCIPWQATSQLPMQYCASCIKHTAAFVYCMYCSAPLRTATVSAEARKSHADTIARFDELMVAGRKMATLKAHKAAWVAFSKFMLRVYQAPAIQATPVHVVAWLVSQDSKGRTVVHTGTCARYRVPLEHPLPICTRPAVCTKRLKASAAKAKAMALRAYFRDEGHATPWNGAAGNPANSPYVTHYLAGSKKEQLAAGVVTKKAPMFDEDVYHTMIVGLLVDVSGYMASGAMLEAYLTLQDALALSLLFSVPDRSVDVGLIRYGDLELFTVTPAPPGPLAAAATTGGGGSLEPGGSATGSTAPTRTQALRLHLGLNKTSLAGSHGAAVEARSVILPDSSKGPTSSPVTLYKALEALRVRGDIMPPPGPADYLLLARSCLKQFDRPQREGGGRKGGYPPPAHELHGDARGDAAGPCSPGPGWPSHHDPLVPGKWREGGLDPRRFRGRHPVLISLDGPVHD